MSFFRLFLCPLLGLIVGTITAWGQTPEAPILRCVNVLPDGTIEITWTPGSGSPITVCSGAGSGSPFAAYEIYVSTDGSAFTLLASVADANQTTYIDNTSNASNTLYYYVRTICGTVSSPQSAVVDSQDPSAPFVLGVTVQDAFTTSLSWTPSTAPETYGYIIYRADENGNFVPLDTVYVNELPAGNLQTYNDFEATPSENPEAYKIAAIDSCTQEPGPDNNMPHQTIHLITQGDECSQTIAMSWTEYEGWTDGVASYEIGLSDGTNVVTLPGDSTFYRYQLPEGTNTACLIVKAIHTNGTTTSLSNIVCTTVNPEQQPDYIYMTNIGVTNDNKVEIEWAIDLSSPLTQLHILRSIADTSELAFADTYPIGSNPTSPMNYTDNDNDVRADRYSYAYRIQHTDPCGHEFVSTTAQTILLDGQDNLNFSNGLAWSALYITYAQVSNYQIYRADSIAGNFELIATVGGNTLAYDDDFSTLIGAITDKHCYYVVANYTIDLPDGTLLNNLSSRSNIICINQTSRVFVPNAFLPNGVNNVFKPLLIFPDEDTYSMLIMNRWGEIVFKTNDPNEGWNGEYKNDLAPQGSYAYVIQMTTPTGYQIERKGTVTLIR
jgi:gliding motility-associated-like protein